ncbi:MAG: RES family NAD+ phosphorylase [Endozoicomonadaceae bacterium]|nr:RES family NAD+ phosphorylase [Endozoicomonadaceae bacterium]
MIPAYRLVKKKWISSAFDGEGAKLFGGRWNSAGHNCVYATSSESLAVLEILVHVRDNTILSQYTMLSLNIDEKFILSHDPEGLPTNWNANPPPEETALYGDGWLDSGVSAALSLPSSIIPREKNFLLNVNHPDFDEILATATQLDFDVDERLGADKHSS